MVLANSCLAIYLSHEVWNLSLLIPLHFLKTPFQKMDFTTVWSSPGRKKFIPTFAKILCTFFFTLFYLPQHCRLFMDTVCAILFSHLWNLIVLILFAIRSWPCPVEWQLSDQAARNSWLETLWPKCNFGRFFPCIIKLTVVYASKHFGRFWDGLRFWGDLLDDLVLVVAMVIPFTVPKPGMLIKLLFWASFLA